MWLDLGINLGTSSAKITIPVNALATENMVVLVTQNNMYLTTEG